MCLVGLSVSVRSLSQLVLRVILALDGGGGDRNRCRGGVSDRGGRRICDGGGSGSGCGYSYGCGGGCSVCYGGGSRCSVCYGCRSGESYGGRCRDGNGSGGGSGVRSYGVAEGARSQVEGGGSSVAQRGRGGRFGEGGGQEAGENNLWFRGKREINLLVLFSDLVNFCRSNAQRKRTEIIISQKLRITYLKKAKMVEEMVKNYIIKDI